MVSWSPAEFIIIRSDTLLVWAPVDILSEADAGFEPSWMQRYWISSFRDNSKQIRFYSENSDLIEPIQI